ncbi:MAG: gliding motility-associated C-terminal domain-containing protein [Bacteroidetes bacterium]|nr:gliding motility-associated C-terminal domain-containing protein [Bacteroidota bacterium]
MMIRYILIAAVWCLFAQGVNGQAVIGPKFNTPCTGTTFGLVPVNGVNGDVVPANTKYSWAAPTMPAGLTGGVAATLQLSINGTLVNSTNYSLQAVYNVVPTNAFGVQNGATFTVTINVLPYAKASDIKVIPSNPKVCSGLSTSLGCALSSSSTIVPTTEIFTWYSDAALNNTISNVNVYTTPVLSNNTTYYITVSGANACANTVATAFSFTVNVDGIAPEVNQPPSQVVCAGGSTNIVSFTSAATVYNAGVVYNWTNSTTSIGLAAAGSGTIASFNPVNAGSDIVTATIIVTPFTASGSYACSGNPKTFTIKVVPIPFVASQLLPVCSGTTLSYTAVGVPSGTTYSWTPVSIPAGITGADPVATPRNSFNPTLINTTLAPINVEFIVTPRTGSNLCAGNAFTITVTVKPRPVVTDKVTTSCSGATFAVSPTGVPESTFYTWGVPVVISGSISGSNSQASQQYFVGQVLTNNGNTPAVIQYLAVPITSGCSGNPFSVLVTVNPKPVLDNSGSKSVCNNFLFTFTPTTNVAGTSLQWARSLVGNITNPASNGTGAISETLVNVSNNTELVTYAFTLTANSCSYNQELLVSVRPTLSLASDLTKITCSKDPFYYIGVSTASGTILSWTRTAVAGISNPTAAGVNIPVSEVLVNTTASPINVTYRYQNQLGTCSDITNVVVTVNPLPAVNVVTDKIYCSGATVLIPLSGSSVSGTDYNWESTNVNIGLPNAGSGDISFVANNTSYVPIKTNLIITPMANGCMGTPVAFTITVNPTPTLTSDFILPPICSGSTQTYTPTSFIANTVFNWSRATVQGIDNPGTNGIGVVNEKLINSSNVPLVVTYNYVLTASGCSSPLLPVYATVNPTPAMFNPGDQTACNNGLKIINFTGSVISGTEYLWTSSNPAIGAPLLGSGDMYFVATNPTNSAISSTITVYPKANSCSGTTITFKQVVNTALVLSSGLTPPDVCSNTPFQYTPSSTVPNVLFSWNRNITPGISNVPTSGSGSILESLVNSTSSAVKVTYEYSLVSQDGCTNTQNVVLNINPALVISNAGGSYEICSGNSFKFVPNANITNVPYLWTRAFIPGISSPTGDASIEVQYIYRIGQAVTCASDQAVKVTVKPLPKLTGSKSIQVCSNAPVAYTPIGNIPGTNFDWTRNPVPGISNVTGTGVVGIGESLFNYTSGNVAVVYKYRMTNYNGCINSEDLEVIVKPLPDLSPISLEQSLCAGDTTKALVFTNSLPPGTIFNWVNSQPGIGLAASGTGNIPAFKVTNNSSGQLIAQIRVTPNLNGCDGISIVAQNIIVNRAISGSFIESAPGVACPGIPVGPLVASVPLGGDGSTYAFQWQSSTDGITFKDMPGFITRQIIDAPINNNKWYRMRTVSLGCSALTNAVKVEIKEKPKFRLDNKDNYTVSIGNSTQVVLVDTGKSRISSVLWTPATDISSIRSFAPFLSPKTNTTYKVVGTSVDGCLSDTGKVDIKVINGFLIYPNNVLTPNGDGYNDTWKIKNIEFYPKNSIKIYNANGQLVKELGGDLGGYKNDWAGTGKSETFKLTTGTYYYVININEGEAIIKGFITLLN